MSAVIATPRVSQISPGRRPRPDLRCRVTWRDGSQFAGELSAQWHRMIQLGLLHRRTDGLVELTPGTRDRDGRLHVDRRSRPEHYLPGGASGRPGWLRQLLEHTERITTGEYATRLTSENREEVFVGVAARHEPRGSKHAVSDSRFLWVDIDRPDRLEILWAFLADRPCHLLVESAGSGGVHAYWQLDRPLPARFGDREPIEQANLRIIHALGDDVADRNCRERSRVLRLAGTINYKTGQDARITEANLALPPYDAGRLVGDLADPSAAHTVSLGAQRGEGETLDRYKRVPAPAYFATLAGITVPPCGSLVRCPAHDDEHPSCSVSGAPDNVWHCLGGETEVITDEGTRVIADLAGSSQRVLTVGGRWVEAPFRTYGAQPLWRIVVRRNRRTRELFATHSHRWFVTSGSKYPTRREVTTEHLVPGQQLTAVFPSTSPRRCKLNLSPFGVARGFTFGDGHRCGSGSRAGFCGPKDQPMLAYFPMANTYYNRSSGALSVADLPRYFKELPDIDETPSYLYGWLAGYFAADGDISNRGVSINCSDRAVLERVQAICTRVGIGTYGISCYRRRGINGKVSSICRLRLLRSDLTPEFFALPHHRAEFTAHEPRYERRHWIVAHVEKTDRVEDVYCATVPGAHSFVLAENILTGNCHACGAGGTIYDLASAVLGGPTGPELRGQAFKRARAYVVELLGEVKP